MPADLTPKMSCECHAERRGRGAATVRAPRLIPWRNWSGGQSCLPAARLVPKNLDELTSVISQAQGRIRPVGSAHSFSALVPTDGTLLSLSYCSGLLDHDGKTLQAEFGAGTPMSRKGLPLCLPNTARRACVKFSS